jgi:glutathione peroxidase
MKLLTLLFSVMFLGGTPEKFYSFTFKTLEGKEVSMSQFKGKKILIVNTASKCGYTKQYASLQQLQETYGEDLVIIGFPANNFGNQEPGSNEDIQEFCQQNYGVTFLMADKSSVKGDDIHPLFAYLTSLENPDFKGDIQWNFEKFLIDEKGKLIHRFRSKTDPMSKDITEKL